MFESVSSQSSCAEEYVDESPHMRASKNPSPSLSGHSDRVVFDGTEMAKRSFQEEVKSSAELSLFIDAAIGGLDGVNCGEGVVNSGVGGVVGISEEQPNRIDMNSMKAPRKIFSLKSTEGMVYCNVLVTKKKNQ